MRNVTSPHSGEFSRELGIEKATHGAEWPSYGAEKPTHGAEKLTHKTHHFGNRLFNMNAC
jgi:hypothetical protein